MPAWLRLTLGVFGVLIVIGALYVFGLHVLILVKIGKTGWMQKSGTLLAAQLGYVTGTLICMMFGGWLAQIGFKKRSASLASSAAQVAKASVPPPVPTQPARRVSRKRWQSANVLQVGAGFRKVWGFASGRRGFTLSE